MTTSSWPDDHEPFGPDSELWRINRYATGLVFGPSAVLMQIAHPRVAQGVSDHSRFRQDALGRLRRTLRTVNQIVFGTRHEAAEMRARLTAVHDRVTGRTSPGVPGPSVYSAFEPDLLLWVLATLFDATVKGYHFAWGALPRDRCDRLYRDFRRFGAFAGLGEEVGPSDYEDFRRYYDGMLAESFLGSHPLSSEIAEAVVHPSASWRDRILGHVTDFLPIETLPPRIRLCLGLRSTWWTRVRMAMFRAVAPLAFQVCPKRLTYYPESFRAERARGLL